VARQWPPAGQWLTDWQAATLQLAAAAIEYRFSEGRFFGPKISAMLGYG